VKQFPQAMNDAVCAAIESKLSTAILSVVAGKALKSDFAVAAMPHIQHVCRSYGFTLTAFRVDQAALIFRFLQTKDLLNVALVLPPYTALPVSAWTEVPNWYVRYEINGKKFEAGPFPSNEIAARFAYIQDLKGVGRAAPIHCDLRVGSDWTLVATGPWSPIPQFSTLGDFIDL
jgi:hypothetical protein